MGKRFSDLTGAELEAARPLVAAKQEASARRIDAYTALSEAALRARTDTSEEARASVDAAVAATQGAERALNEAHDAVEAFLNGLPQ